MSFSASANVSLVTSGPVPFPVPKVGGAPAVVGDDGILFDCVALRHAVTPTSTPSGARIRNWRRVFMVWSLGNSSLAGKSPLLVREIDGNNLKWSDSSPARQ